MSNFCRFYTLSFLVMALSVSLSSAGDGCRPTELARENLRQLATANNELALNLLRSLSGGASENLFFSPLSISTAFGMLFYGAKGDTAEELRNVLGYNIGDLPDELVHSTFKYFLQEVLKNGESTDAYVLNSANSVVVDNHLELAPDFKNDVEDLYEASVHQADFAGHSESVVNKINSWIKQKTNGKIDKLIEELDASTIMVLLNAVYFKGTWKIKFDEAKTKPDIFYNHGLETSAKKVPTMHMKARFRHADIFDCQVLELPYKRDNISMLLLLPNQRDGLESLEQKLSPEKLSEIQAHLTNKKVIISLPRYKLEYSKELSEDFKKMGASRIFDAGSSDFSGLSPSSLVAVSQVLHKAVLEVNEEGSEAAASTAVVANRMRPLFDNTPLFTADHPFLFAIVENRSGMLLFMGQVNEL